MQLVKLMLLFVAVQALEDTPAPDQQCPDDWSYFQGTCYYHSGESTVPWMKVPSECYNLHPAAQPVSIHDNETNHFLTFTLALQYTNGWLGLLRDQKHPDDEYWLDGSAVNYTNWYYGNPNHAENCASLCSTPSSSAIGQWFSKACSRTEHSYFCQVKPNSSSVANN